jgi:hypothetical protein
MASRQIAIDYDVEFLLSDAASYMNGSAVVVGGASARCYPYRPATDFRPAAS